ncbi:MAG: cytochrome c3 family protein, partial [Acidobacteria bacterium]|nr:cytochrome c3 family protein [Acidobacteriota bacterium]
MTTQRFVRAAVLIAAASWPAAAALQRLPPWTGGRSVPVHRIHLIDEFDQVIVPTGLRPLPFSARTTCGPCHDYPSIQGGLHFDAASSEPAGRPGQPWIWVDAKTGTVLPLSYRGWPGCWKPAQVGLSAWDVTLLFGRHMPGGGPGERGAGEADSESRWEVSGKLEINCLGCHNASRLQDHSEWAKQVLRENFRWAAAASSGLAEVGGMTSRLRATWDLFDGPNPDDREWAVAPSVAYDRDAFDGKHRVVIEIGDRPDDARCLDCHSVSAAGSMRFLDEGDVHSAAGLRCADCHRNDLSHAMIRGYEGEAEEAGRPEIGDFTCRGCHLGSRVGAGGTTGSGRLGAPYPLHRGLPPHHLDRLSCTACHSGSLPQEEPVRVRESRANRLGIHGVAQWATDYPHIQEPVFLRDVNGKLTPHRMTWPSFWGRIGGDGVQPLRPSQVMAVAGDEFDAEGRIARLLSALDDPEIGGIPVLVFRGKVYEPDLDGGLSASTYAGGIATAGPSLAVKKDGAVAPLIPAP